MSQAMSKPVVAQQPQLHTEVTPQCTAHSCPWASVSSQQGCWDPQSTPDPNPRWAPGSKKNDKSFCPHGQPILKLQDLPYHSLYVGTNPSVNFSQGNIESGLTLTAWTIHLALSWRDMYWDSWPKTILYHAVSMKVSLGHQTFKTRVLPSL